MMARITPEIRRTHGRAAELVPESVLAAIDQAELADRLSASAGLIQKSRSSATTPRDRAELADRARKMLAAQPRSLTEHEVAARVTKAAVVPKAQGDALRAEALRILAENPPAPYLGNRGARAAPVVKAGGDALMLVCDCTGKVVGVCDPAAITPVTSLDAVAKARLGGRRDARP